MSISIGKSNHSHALPAGKVNACTRMLTTAVLCILLLQGVVRAQRVESLGNPSADRPTGIVLDDRPTTVVSTESEARRSGDGGLTGCWIRTSGENAGSVIEITRSSSGRFHGTLLFPSLFMSFHGFTPGAPKLRSIIEESGDGTVFSGQSLFKSEGEGYYKDVSVILISADRLLVRGSDFKTYYDRVTSESAATARVDYGKAKIAMEREQFGKAKDLLDRVAERLPQDPHVLNDVAWLLATHRDPAMRNADAAVRAAREANRLTGNSNAMYADTLAAALAAAGQMDDACRIQQQALIDLEDATENRGSTTARWATRYAGNVFSGIFLLAGMNSDFQARLKMYERGEAYVE